MDELEALLRAEMARAAVADRFDQIAGELPELIKSISEVEQCQSVAVVAGLTTVPEFHPNIIRLEALVHLCLVHGRGTRRANVEDLHGWLNRELGTALLCRMEDPVEDVFVSNVITGRGNRRVFNGIWDTPDAWLQDLIDVLETAPRRADFNRLRAEVDALLTLSEAVADRSGLQRFISSTGEPYRDIELRALDLHAVATRVTFSVADLQQLGIDRDLLLPFSFDVSRRADLAQQASGTSDLQRKPLIQCGDKLLFALPAAASACLRMHIVANIVAHGEVRPFASRLLQRQTQKLFNEAMRFGGQMDDLSSLLPPSGIDAKRMSEVAVRFDSGRIAHIVLLHDDLEEILEEGLTSYKQPPQAFQEKFSKYLENATNELRSRENPVGGITLVVMGGIGRGFGMLAPTMPEQWAFTVWSLPDVYGLAWTEQQWLLTLWKLVEQVREVEERGIELDTNAGDVNVYSYWSDEHYRLVPREFPINAENASMTFAPGHVAAFRQSFRKSFDIHAAFRPDERAWITIQRMVPKAYFKEIESQPVYACPDAAARGVLRGVVETAQRSWWVDGGTGQNENWKRDTQYRVWDATLNWLTRLAPELEQRLSLPAGNIIVRLDFGDPELWEEHGNDLPPEQDPPLEISTFADPPQIVVRLRRSIFSWMRRPVNDGERAVVQAVADGALRLSGVTRADRIVEEVVRVVVTSPDARWMHLFPHPQSVRDELAHFDRGPGRTTQEPDQKFATLSLSWSAVAPGTERIEIAGEREGNRFLNKLVDVLWNRVKASLGQLDRRSLVEFCLRNHEGLVLDRELWHRTARALVTVYRDREDIESASARHEGDINRGTLVSRVLAEMAASTCPVEGARRPGTADFDELVADVAWIIGIAYDSDALHSGLTEPRILVFPNGEFSVSERFFEDIVAPYQNGYFAERFEENIQGYSDLYEQDQPHGRPVEEVFEPDFIVAFEEEYGLAIQDLVRADEVLQQYAVDHRSMVVDLTVAELSENLRNAGVTAEHIDAFLREFCLAPRDQWDETPPGFEPKDWYPWRFRRHLSLMTRPVVLVGVGNNDRALYAPGLVHDAFAHVVGGAHLGTFDTEYFRSARMQRWIGAINDRRGHTFNDRVAEECRSAGYQARASVDMVQFNVPAELGNLGDVDVLAWTHDGLVHPTECKNLRFARTIGEIVDQLNRFKGESNDELAKHMRRCDWLRNHVAEVARLTGVAAERIRIEPLMVTNTIVPMQFASGLPIAVENIVPVTAISARLR